MRLIAGYARNPSNNLRAENMSKRRDHAVEFAVIGVTAGATGAVVIAGLQHIADPGDLLGFLGGAVGAVITVGAASWIEQRRRLADNEARIAPFRSVFTAIGNCLESLERAVGDDIRENLGVIVASREAVALIRPLAATENLDLIMALRSYDLEMDVFEHKVEDAIKSALYFSDGTSTIQANLEKAVDPMKDRVARIIAIVTP